LDAVERAAAVVRTYGAGGYTGAAFDTYGHNDPARITPDDLIALSMLSIQIRESEHLVAAADVDPRHRLAGGPDHRAARQCVGRPRAAHTH
jgi:hypothetical protein